MPSITKTGMKHPWRSIERDRVAVRRCRTMMQAQRVAGTRSWRSAIVDQGNTVVSRVHFPASTTTVGGCSKLNRIENVVL